MDSIYFSSSQYGLLESIKYIILSASFNVDVAQEFIFSLKLFSDLCIQGVSKNII